MEVKMITGDTLVNAVHIAIESCILPHNYIFNNENNNILDNSNNNDNS